MRVTPTPFNSILVANRGEIACRVMRTAQTMGLKTVAVYSDADANTPHVKMANQAYCLGPAPVSESYLRIDKILAAAKATGAQAIHPGYGFLSENAEFAKACADAGLVFIGPRPDAIDLMGDKAKAKRQMIKAGVPCVPGYQDEKQDDKTLLKAAETIGCPLMVKAAAGGGGRGMRLVHSKADLPNALKAARSEALNAFGSDTLILERAIIQPRHVEIQVFADQFGNTIHLGERDCSVQRRHQKVLEEAPCPVMTLELRAKMGEAAVKAAKDIGYVGAGTVEFMLDASGEFFFLEMNTRLQVEHPVTEMITGLDLVALQIRVARGEALGLTQDDIHLSGHAIEARLYAEDPGLDFLPATGPIHLWAPASGEGVRIDCGIETGSEISPFYDPMIAKVMAHGPTRDDARRKLVRALKDTALFGLKTNQSFLIDALDHPAFTAGKASTAFIAENFTPEQLEPKTIDIKTAAIAAIIQYGLSRDQALVQSLSVAPALLNWSSATKINTPYRYAAGDDEITVNVIPETPDRFSVSSGEQTVNISVRERTKDRITLNMNGDRIDARFRASDTQVLDLLVNGHVFNLTNLNAVIASAKGTSGAGQIVAPMHGTLLSVNVNIGDSVQSGDRLAVLEAMKMQHDILADIDGTITSIHAETGAQIAADALMIEIEADKNEESG